MTNRQPSPAGDSDLQHLAGALGMTRDLMAGVEREQAHLPTPCREFDVSQLLDHLVGWAVNFADKANGIEPATDPETVTAGDHPSAEYQQAGARLIDGYRSNPDHDAHPLGIVILETVTHGWDLAVATGQAPTYSDEVIETALAAGRRMLKPEYRGDGRPFGPELDAPTTGSALDQLVAFMGRDPHWTA